jgi:hypothetical protein
MVRKLLQWIVICIPVSYLLLSWGIVHFIQHHSYQYLLSYYTIHWPTAFDVTVFSERCLTPIWYNWVVSNALWLKIIIAVAVVMFCVLLKPIRNGVQLLFEDLLWGTGFIKKVLVGLTVREKWLLLALFMLIGCYRFYFFVKFPMHPDEAASYLFFARQGPLMAAVNYVTTNNHIFLNLVCSLLAKLPFLSPKLIMRLPAMVGDMALLLGIFCVVKQYGRFARAISIVAGVAFSYILSYYATQGRGYQGQEICAVIGMGACWLYFFAPAKYPKKGYGLFIASSVIGFYLNPLFVYPFLTLMLAAGYCFIKGKNFKTLVSFIKAVAAIVLLTFVLYWPLIVTSSWHALVNNGFINENKYLSDLAGQVSTLVFNFNYVINYGSAGIGVLAFGIMFSLVVYYKGYVRGLFYQMMLIWFVAAVASFVIITVYQRIFPLERALCFWILIVNIILLNVLYDLFEKFFPQKAILLFTVLITGKVLFSIRTIYWPKYWIDNKEQVVIYNEIQPQFEALTALGVTTWQITHVDDYYSMFLPLYLKSHNKVEAIVLNRERVIGDVIFLPDTCVPGFDLTGYKLWKDKQVTAKGKLLSIYAKEKLIVR